MKVNSLSLLESLLEQTNVFIKKAERLKTINNKELNWKENKQSWSILECLEHLNLYGDFYLPEIKQRISNSTSKSEAVFKSGFLGNYFANSMLPKNKLNKMKTFKDKDPINSNLDENVIDRFINQQKELLILLQLAKNTNLNKVKTSITLSKFIHLKLGDTFRFLVNHNLRHFLQIEKIEEQIKN